MLDRIRELEKTARLLDPDAATRSVLAQKALEYSQDFLGRLGSAPVYLPTDDEGIGLYDSPISEEPVDIDAALRLLRYNVDRPGLSPGSGGFMGFIPGGGLYHAALGDYLAAVANRYAGIFFASPGAVRMENMLLAWLAEVVGYPKECGGALTSGGSIANLTGIVTARDAYPLAARDFDKAVVYLTSQAHHSVEKALRIAGLTECVKHSIEIDQHYRMRPDVLEQAIAADKKSGLRPWLIVAAAGTTDTGAVDPLDDISTLASRYDLWLHIDGAYGALFALCDAGKRILKGMQNSDSITMDPHKSLFLPYGTGAVLVKDRQRLYDSQYYQAGYMQDALQADSELSPADLSPELTKHFRGLRLWLPLKLLGLRPFRAALEEKMLLARYFHQRLQAMDGFVVGPPPDLSVVAFRFIPRRGDADTFNQMLVQAVQRDGRVFMSSTVLDGHFVIRLAVLAFRTHLDDIERALEVLDEKAKALQETH
jgi:glutamate/tyrosine decarboxylase-like PLP-dependent enzyme